AIVSESRRNEGVGLAISSNLVKWVVERLRKDGRVQRGFLGLVPQSVNRDLVEGLRSQEVRSMADFLKVTGLEKPEGAYIARVERGTPAWRAGLRAGDIILEFDGAKVRSSKDIFFKVAEVDPGTKVSVRVIRNREPRSFDVTLAERPGRDFNGRPRR
ncbi:MAG: PDZ domain-containing protein, partial [Planctomycetota bacterium]|nr:PDZ domain-containing protein [Planctomycetota bacterium]